MKVKSVPLSSLREDPDNANTHPPSQLRAIQASMERFGQQIPLVVDGDGVVLAGNARLKVMDLMGWTKCDVVQTPLKGAEARAFALADNQLARLSEANAKLVAEQLRQIAKEESGLALATGFDEHALARMGAIAWEGQDPDLGGDDEDEEGGGRGGGRGGDDPVSGDPPPTGKATYMVVFDDVIQQERFFAFLRWLRTEVPGETLGDRLMTWLDRVWKE